MLNKTIPYKNLLMRCDELQDDAFGVLPEGYYFRMYQDGDERLWVEVEFSIGEFERMSVKQVEDYFKNEYYSRKDLLYKRCVFVMNSAKKAVGTCMAWYDHKNGLPVASVHWLAVNPRYQRLGIGRALMTKVLRIFNHQDEFPVYLHTQPWSFNAVRLYADLGFNLLKTEGFSDFNNEFDEGMMAIKPFLDNNFYNHLLDSAE